MTPAALTPMPPRLVWRIGSTYFLLNFIAHAHAAREAVIGLMPIYWYDCNFQQNIALYCAILTLWYYIQLLFTVYTVDKTQISVQLQQNTKAIYSTSINEQFETNLS